MYLKGLGVVKNFVQTKLQKNEYLIFEYTIPEASQLVLEAGSMGKEGEVFILETVDPVKIVDLAKNMVIKKI